MWFRGWWRVLRASERASEKERKRRGGSRIWLRRQGPCSPRRNLGPDPRVLWTESIAASAELGRLCGPDERWQY